MPMSEAQRTATARQLAKDIFVSINATATLTVADLKAAVDAIDDALETVMSTMDTTKTIEAALKAALPEPFNGTSTTAQKGAILAVVALKKYT